MAAIEWTAHLANKASEKQKFLETLAHSTIVVDRLRDIIQQKITSIDNTEFNTASYEDVNWCAKQSFLNGKRSTYRELLNLLTL